MAWKTEHTTNPGQRKQKNVPTATVFVLDSFLPACERMRHLHTLQLDVTHAHTHLQDTQQSQTRSKQRPSVLCLSSVGKQMEDISQGIITQDLTTEERRDQVNSVVIIFLP